MFIFIIRVSINQRVIVLLHNLNFQIICDANLSRRLKLDDQETFALIV